LKRKRISRDVPKQSASRAVHLSEYLAILREHKWIALVPFLLIVGGAVALTLLSEPVYEASSLVAIENDQGAGGIVGELQLVDTMAKVDAEMEIMRSRRVAGGAAALLTEPTEEDLRPFRENDEERREFVGKAHRMSDFLYEVHYYRPLEVLLRAFGDTLPPCNVELQCEPLPGRQAAEQYEFRFARSHGGDRYTLDVYKIRQHRFGSERESELVEMESGQPFHTFRRTFTLTVDGDPVGRTYGVVLRSREGILNWLQAHTFVSQLGRSTGIVALGCRAETPRLAQAAAWALAHSFHHTKQSQKREDAGRTVDFLEDRTRSVHAELNVAEDALGAFQAREGVTILSEKAKLYVERISALERERVELEVRLDEEERLRADLERDAVDPARATLYATSEDPMAAELVAQLTQSELEYTAEKATLTDEHPRVRAILERTRAAREKLKEHVIARARAEGELVRKHLARVQGEIERVESEARDLPTLEKDLAQLTRKTASLAAVYNFLLEKQHEAEIARESVFSNVRIVDDPILPGTRTSPNLLINLLIGLFLGLLAALGTAFFAEYLDRSVKSPEELEHALGLPLYAALPAFKSVRSREMRRLQSAMVTIEKPQSVLAEGYRSLRANIRFADFESPVRVFAITSAVLGEGKTTTTLNLAVVLAQAGSQVLVVDADLRRPASHTHLKGQLSPGLSDVLQNRAAWRSVVRTVPGVENLSVMHAGEKPGNPGALFDSPHFAGIIEELKRDYEYVLFDVPPVLAVSDAASFFRQLDALFLLVQWRRCPIDVVLAAKEQAERLGANLRGVIFNGFDARKSARRGYGHYGYYGYYGYYGKYRGYTYGYGADDERKRKPRSTSASVRR